MGDGFIATYKRHTPFSMVVFPQLIETDKITIQPKGDLVSYMYMTRTEIKTGKIIPWDWSAILEFEWWIGEKLIDRHDINYIRYVNPDLVASSLARSKLDNALSLFMPLCFSFCQHIPFPIVALQFDKMYIKLKFGDTYNTSLYRYECHVNYIFMDQKERDFCVKSKISMPITQVQQIFNKSDVMLRNPVKFIATPSVKIPDDFQYALKVNGTDLRPLQHYAGAENYHHTNNSSIETASIDVYPPQSLVSPSTFLSTAYGRGYYSVDVSSNSFTTVPWGATDGTTWESKKRTVLTTRFDSDSTSNSTNAWTAFSTSNVWKSSPTFGTISIAITGASSNVSNAWMNPWVSDGTYGKLVSTQVQSNASSNSGNSWYAFDETSTEWRSEPYIYFSDYIGTFTMNASSNATGTNVVSAFTGSSTWKSNAMYGYSANIGTYTANASSYTIDAWKSFSYDVTQYWVSNNSYYQKSATTNSFVNTSSNLYNLISNSVNVINGATNPWVSNSFLGTYGFSSRFGVYESNASSNLSNSWKSFDGNAQTMWVSNAVYLTKFDDGALYNLYASSNTTNAWLAVDFNESTAWVSDGTPYGSKTVAGSYSFIGSSNVANTWLAFDRKNTVWTPSNIYGNVLSTTGVFTMSASSNVANAWKASNTEWVGSNVYGLVSVFPGVYIASNSSSTSNLIDNTFVRSSLWTSNVNYGPKVSAGAYTCSNNFGTSAGVYTSTTNRWRPTTAEFLSTAQVGVHTMSASSNSANAWIAFSDTGTGFDWNVATYNTLNRANLTFATGGGGGGTIITNTYNVNSDSYQFIANLGQNYSHTKVGMYTASASSNTTNAWKVFDGVPTTTWTGTTRYDQITGGAINGIKEYIQLDMPAMSWDTQPSVVANGSVSVLVPGSGGSWVAPTNGIEYSNVRFQFDSLNTKSSISFANWGITSTATDGNFFSSTVLRFNTNNRFGNVKYGTYSIEGQTIGGGNRSLSGIDSIVRAQATTYTITPQTGETGVNIVIRCPTGTDFSSCTWVNATATINGTGSNYNGSVSANPTDRTFNVSFDFPSSGMSGIEYPSSPSFNGSISNYTQTTSAINISNFDMRVFQSDSISGPYSEITKSITDLSSAASSGFVSTTDYISIRFTLTQGSSVTIRNVSIRASIPVNNIWGSTPSRTWTSTSSGGRYYYAPDSDITLNLNESFSIRFNFNSSTQRTLFCSIGLVTNGQVYYIRWNGTSWEWQDQNGVSITDSTSTINPDVNRTYIGYGSILGYKYINGSGFESGISRSNGDYYTCPFTRGVSISSISATLSSDAYPYTSDILVNDPANATANATVIYIVITRLKNGSTSIPTLSSLNASGTGVVYTYTSPSTPTLTYTNNFVINPLIKNISTSPSPIPYFNETPFTVGNNQYNTTYIPSASLGGPLANTIVPSIQVVFSQYIRFDKFDIVTINAVTNNTPTPTDFTYSTFINGEWSSESSNIRTSLYTATQTVTLPASGNYMGLRINVYKISKTSSAATGQFFIYLYDNGTLITPTTGGLQLYYTPTCSSITMSRGLPSVSFLPTFSASTNTQTAASVPKNGYYPTIALGDYLEFSYTDPARAKQLSNIEVQGVFDPLQVQYSVNTGFAWTAPVSTFPILASSPPGWRVYFPRSTQTSSNIFITNIIIRSGGNDIRVMDIQNGGEYKGTASTPINSRPTPINGEWIEYTPPNRLTFNKVKITPPITGTAYPSSWHIAGFTGSGWDLLTSNTTKISTNVVCSFQNTNLYYKYRFIVEQSNVGANSPSVKIGQLIYYTDQGRKSVNAKSNTTNVITSGMVANFYGFNDKTLSNPPLYSMNNYTFDTITFRGQNPNTSNVFSFEGKVVCQFPIDSTTRFYSNSAVHDIHSIVVNSTPLSSYSGLSNTYNNGPVISSGTEFNLKIVSNGLPGVNFFIGGTRLEGQWFAGGAYNGFDSANVWTQINLPYNASATDYLFDSGTAERWQIIRGGSVISSNTAGSSLYTLPTPGPYNSYRLAVNKTIDGELYSNVGTLVYRDTNGRSIFKDFGTYTDSVPIGLCPVGMYEVSPQSFWGILNGTGPQLTSPTNVVIKFPKPVTIKVVYVDGTSFSYTTNITGGSFNTNYNSFVSPTTTDTVTFNISFTLGGFMNRMYLLSSDGVIFPKLTTASNQFVIYNETGGNYTGTSLSDKEWVNLSVPAQTRLYKYDLYSNTMPASWSIQGHDGTAWNTIETVSNRYSSDIYHSTFPTGRGPYSNIRVVINETVYNGRASLLNMNLYSKNMIDTYKPGNITSPITGSSQISGITYSGTGTFTDREWTSNNGPLIIDFAGAQVNMTKLVYSSVETRHGLILDSFIPGTNSLPGFQNANNRNKPPKLVTCLTTQTINPTILYGYLYTNDETSFTFEVNTGTTVYVNSAQVINAGVFIGTKNTFYKIYMFNTTGTSSIIVKINGRDDLPGYLFPTASKDVSFFDAPTKVRVEGYNNSGSMIPLLSETVITKSRLTSLTMNNPAYVTSIRIYTTAIETGNPLPSGGGYTYTVMRDVKLFDEYGQINSLNAYGGYYANPGTGEWVEISFSAPVIAHSYQLGSKASKWTLFGDSVSIDSRESYSAPSRFTISNPTAKTTYRLVVHEMGNTSSYARVSSFRLFDVNGLELNPGEQNGNVYSLPTTKSLGTSLPVTITSSMRAFDPLYSFDSSVGTHAYMDSYTSQGYSLLGYNREYTMLSNVFYGEWLQMELPQPVSVDRFSLQITSPLNSPNTFVFACSNDAVNWVSGNLAVNYFKTLPTPTDYYFNNDAKTNSFRYYRFAVSNIASPVSICEFGKINLWRGTSRVNSYVYGPTFGGPGLDPSYIDIMTPSQISANTVIIRSDTGRFPTSINFNSATVNTYTRVDSNVYFNVPSTPVSNPRITFNELNYNPYGSSVQLQSVELIGPDGKLITPTATGQTSVYTQEGITSVPHGTYSVSNVFPFDDLETTWTGRNFDIRFPVQVSVVGYSIVNGTITNWQISNTTSVVDTRTETLVETSNYYSLATTSNYFSFSSSTDATVGGFVLYDTNGRITPKFSNLTQFVDPYSPIKGGQGDQHIIFSFPPGTDIYSYTIYANPFPTDWDLMTDFSFQRELHKVSNYYTNVSSESFVLSTTSVHPDYRFRVLGTQPSTVSTARINYIQFYDRYGKMMFPVMTSNTTYVNSERSGEVYGQYEVLASSYKPGNTVENAFDGNALTYYESIGYYLPTLTTPMTLQFSNTTVYNCTDLRTGFQASRGRILDTNTKYTWTWTGTLTIAASPKLVVDYTARTITKPANQAISSHEAFIISPYLTAPYNTGGYYGEWIQIKMPTSITIGAFRVVGDNLQRLTLMASNDGTTWTKLMRYQYTSESQVFDTPIGAFKYFRIVVEAIDNVIPFKVYQFELYNNYGRLNSYLI